MEKFQLTLGKVVATKDYLQNLSNSNKNIIDFDLDLDIRKIVKAVGEDCKAYHEEVGKVTQDVLKKHGKISGKNDNGEDMFEINQLLFGKKLDEAMKEKSQYVVEFECNPIDINRLLRNKNGTLKSVGGDAIDILLETGLVFDPNEKKKEDEKPKKPPAKKS